MMNLYARNSNFFDALFCFGGLLIGLFVGIGQGQKRGLFGAIVGGTAGLVLGLCAWPLLIILIINPIWHCVLWVRQRKH